jgi:bloom syndrome protein
MDYSIFLSCLHFAVSNSVYCNVVLKPKQVICLEHIFFNFDVLCVLPTGYGKSLIFHLVPALLFAKKHFIDRGFCLWNLDMSVATTIVIVVSPLNALISNQIARLASSGLRASVLGVRKMVAVADDGNDLDALDCDFRLCEEEKLRAGYYHIVFAHPESFISCEYGRQLLNNKTYQDNICAIVIDEAHCILEW